MEMVLNCGKIFFNGEKFFLVLRGSLGFLKWKKKNCLKIFDFLSIVLIKIKMILLREWLYFVRVWEIWKSM